MALTLVDTPFADDANSYVDAAFADTYWDGHYNTLKSDQWTALTASQKDSALISACRILETLRFTYPSRTDQLSPYIPYRLYASQALQFPRTIDIDDIANVGNEVNYFIPDGIKFGQCEQAVFLLTFDESLIASQLAGVIQEYVKAGEVAVSQTFAGSKGTSSGQTMVSPAALAHVSPYLVRGSISLARA